MKLKYQFLTEAQFIALERSNSKEYSPFAKFLRKYKGIEFYKNGFWVAKYEAYFFHNQGERLEIRSAK